MSLEAQSDVTGFPAHAKELPSAYKFRRSDRTGDQLVGFQTTDRTGRHVDSSNYAQQGTARRRASDRDAKANRDRRELSRQMRGAGAVIEKLSHAARSDDPADTADAVGSLEDMLNEMWIHGQHMDDNWCAVVEFMRAALFLEDLKAFTVDQVRVLAEVTERFVLQAPDTDDEDQCITMLEESGLDPWKGLAYVRREIDG